MYYVLNVYTVICLQILQIIYYLLFTKKKTAIPSDNNCVLRANTINTKVIFVSDDGMNVLNIYF